MHVRALRLGTSDPTGAGSAAHFGEALSFDQCEDRVCGIHVHQRRDGGKVVNGGGEHEVNHCGGQYEPMN